MTKPDNWASGEAYEPYVGRWSRLVAAEFLQWLAIPRGASYLEVGCGTGALSEAILRGSGPSSVTGVDPAEGFLTYAYEHVSGSRARFAVADAMQLPFGSEKFDVVLSGLVLNFIPNPEVGLAEMVRVASMGGTVAAYVWDYAGNMQMMRVFWDAAVEGNPGLAEKDEGRRFPICNPDPLAQLFRDAGLSDVSVRPIDVPTQFRDFDDYWLPFLGGQGPAPGLVASLPDGQKAELRERIRAKLPIAADGSISLIARAWAVRGSKA